MTTTDTEGRRSQIRVPYRTNEDGTRSVTFDNGATWHVLSCGYCGSTDPQHDTSRHLGRLGSR